jgi:hypothetical protein
MREGGGKRWRGCIVRELCGVSFAVEAREGMVGQKEDILIVRSVKGLLHTPCALIQLQRPLIIALGLLVSTCLTF